MRVGYEFGEEGLGKDFGGAQMPGAQGFGERSKVSAGLMTGGHASCACMGPGWCADQGWKRIVESSSPDACLCPRTKVLGSLR